MMSSQGLLISPEMGLWWLLIAGGDAVNFDQAAVMERAAGDDGAGGFVVAEERSAAFIHGRPMIDV